MDCVSRPSPPRWACRAFPPERFLVPDVRLFDPQLGLDQQGDLLVADGKITALGPTVQRPPGVEVLDNLAGCWVFPGLVDPHVHLRTPGLEYKEDLESGTAAAAAERVVSSGTPYRTAAWRSPPFIASTPRAIVRLLLSRITVISVACAMEGQSGKGAGQSGLASRRYV